MEKKKFVLRIDARTMAALEKWASDEFRSVNGQLEWIITRYLKERGRLGAEEGMSEGEAGPETEASC